MVPALREAMNPRFTASNVLTALTRLSFLLLVLPALPACASKESQELEAARGRWASSVGERDYDFVYSTGGFGAPEVDHISVHAGAVQSVKIDGRHDVAASRLSDYPTMPKVFDKLAKWNEGSSDVTI